MIALFSRYGRTGNRIVINIHALATVLATGQDFLSYFGKEIIDLSGVSHARIKNSSVRFLPISTDAIPFWLIGKTRALFDSFGLCRNADTVHDMNKGVFASGRLHVLTDWFQRNPQAVKSEASSIRSILAFAKRHRERTNALFEERNGQFPPLFVGMHIRRTDYSEWRNGEWFWAHETYRRFADAFASHIKGQRIVFVVSSDESVPGNLFASNQYDAIVLSGNAFEDMCALSRCDYVMGPRSSFSRVAAYLGNAKYRQLEGENDPCDPMSFIQVPIP